MTSIREHVNRIMEMKETTWVLAIFGLIVLLLILFYLVSWVRDMALGKQGESVSYLTDFQQMFREGKISQDEYNQLKKSYSQNLVATGRVIPDNRDDPPAPDAEESGGNE